MQPRNVLLYGREEPLPKVVPLRAGPVSLIFDSGDLRYLRCEGKETLRRVYVAVRDANWGTVPGVISELETNVETSRFHIRYVSDNRQNGIHFRWGAEIHGAPDGSIDFLLAGKALTAFRRNRIGFCVHHPIEGCAGRPCRVEKVDGTIEHGTFPDWISPHQPFIGIRAIRHEIAPGLAAEVRFEGETFEMEDHRNWTDASYKTYGTPLSLPFPVEVAAGSEIRQAVRFRLIGRPAATGKAQSDRSVRIIPGSPVLPLPSLGLQTATHGQPLSSTESARVRRLRLSHLRASAARLERAVREALALSLPLELEVMLGENPAAELERLGESIRKLKPAIARCLIFHEKAQVTPAQWLRAARKALPGVPLIGGTNIYFTELNRNRPDASVMDGVCFSVNPQVHAFDNSSLIENCAAQYDVVRSAKAFTAAKPVYVTPVTLKPRFNPVATTAEAQVSAGELPPQVDPRQMSLFAACWTLGSLAYLSAAGAAGITYFETTGWRGVMETRKGSPVPERFRSLPGFVFPLWHLLAAVGRFKGGMVLPCRSSEPLIAGALVLKLGPRTRILAANFTAEDSSVEVPVSILGSPLHFLVLDAGNAETASMKPEEFRARATERHKAAGSYLRLKLAPYAIAQVDDFDSTERQLV